ncbi:hypothetical protein [Streptomyces fungicidicus]|uniref:hypothetical protein n=1 Tax=Streptomyces fungicidicus TaxID=68203 RepID=UPI00367374D4
MRRPVAGQVHVHYSQIYIESDPDSFGPDLRESFAGQSAGLCGAATPGALWLSTGLHTGSVGFSVEVLDQAPPLDPAWEDVVEVSFRPVSAGSVLVQWAGAASWDLGARRLADSTAHPRLAAALAAALFTGASFRQLATAGPRDYDDAAATLALHDRPLHRRLRRPPRTRLGARLPAGRGLLRPPRTRRRSGTPRRARGPYASAEPG